jgi:uncharacterized membrane protein YtjA (UPF0391 family)
LAAGFTDLIPPRRNGHFWQQAGDFVPGLRVKFRGFATRNLGAPIGIGSAEAAHQCRRETNIETEGFAMLGWVVTFLIVALIAGILGFGGIAGASVEIAKIIFFIAVVLFLVSAVMGVARGRTRV